SIASISFTSPLKIFEHEIGSTFRINTQRNKFPQRFTLYDVTTGDSIGSRVFGETFRTDMDFVPTFRFPSVGQNKYNIAPTITLSNVDPGAYWIMTERTGRKFVA